MLLSMRGGMDFGEFESEDEGREEVHEADVATMLREGGLPDRPMGMGNERGEELRIAPPGAYVHVCECAGECVCALVFVSCGCSWRGGVCRGVVLVGFCLKGA